MKDEGIFSIRYVRGVQQHLDSKKKNAVISCHIIFRVFGTVDGRNPAPVEVGSVSHYLQGFINPRWLGMGFLNHQQYFSQF